MDKEIEGQWLEIRETKLIKENDKMDKETKETLTKVKEWNKESKREKWKKRIKGKMRDRMRRK